MKVLVIGLGQCGGRIADKFALLNKRSRFERKISVVTDAVAVNTDIADLSGLKTIKPDYKHRITMGFQRTGGHGVGKINEISAEIAKEDADRVVSAIRETERFPEIDAFLLIAGASGGTGSGAIAVLTQHLKQRYVGKPVYNVIVLPFQQEELTEARTIYNTSVCLKSAYLVADAIFLIDNQRYVDKNSTIQENVNSVNRRIVDPFYNLFCAGEETTAKYIGSKILDAGDIIQTLVGWTVIGQGKLRLSRRMLPFSTGSRDFRDRMAATGKRVGAMTEAIGELSLTCDPKDARKALYLLTAPVQEMSMDVIKQLGDGLKAVAPNALIRSGDYPRQKGLLSVTVVLSELVAVRKITSYFTKAIDLLNIVKARPIELDYPERKLEGIFGDIPVLLD